MKIFSLFATLVVALTAISGCAAPDAKTDTGLSPDLAHNARNSLDWAGPYRGILPCADCEGIETAVILVSDGTYSAQSKYLGRSDEVFSEQGRFTWNEAGDTITLPGDQAEQYFVGENQLIRLATDGSRITGDLADNYVLNKITSSVAGKYWKLTELNGQAVPALEREPYFILGSTDGSVSGFGGCNTFGGSYELDEATSRISFGQIVSTMMACPSGMEVEQAFHEVLRTADNYTLSSPGSDQLTLNRARMAPLARFEAVYIY